MASNSTKSFLADAGYGEQELDANSALMELDKGIQKSGLSEGDGVERSGLGSLHESNTKDKYIREFYEARQMCVLKESQVSNICLLIEG